MCKLEVLKAFIYQICAENQHLIKSLNKKGLGNVSIKLSYIENSFGSAKNMEIVLSIKDAVETYAFLEDYISYWDSIAIFQVNNKYLDCNFSKDIRNIIDVYIPSPDRSLVLEQLECSGFLSEKTISELDTIVLYTMAYSLFHEFGHVLYDEEISISEQLRRECVADIFAFGLLKGSACPDNTNLLGTIMGISYVLNKLEPVVELKDKEHPHSIERLYILLKFWDIADDSPYWNLVNQVVRKWSNKYCLPITWIKPTSISDKDKFLDTYLYIKDQKNKE